MFCLLNVRLLFVFFSRFTGSLNQEGRRYRDYEKPARSSWQGAPPGVRSAPLDDEPLPSSAPSAPRPQTRPPSRTFQNSRRPEIRSHSKLTPRPQAPDSERAPRLRTRGPYGPSQHSQRGLHEEGDNDEEEEEGEIPAVTTTYTAHYYKAEREPASVQQREPSRMTDEQPSSTGGPAREASPPPEKPVEKKSYSLARRSRARPSDLSKQASLEEGVSPSQAVPTPAKSETWQAHSDTGTEGGLSRLDQGLARLSLSGQNWTQSPASYLRPEMRGKLPIGSLSQSQFSCCCHPNRSFLKEIILF